MLRFQMRGSEGDIYDVEAERNGDAVRITCTCEAAENGIHCHHRLELLRGDAKALVSSNISDVRALATMVEGTELAAAMVALTAAEGAQAAAKINRDRQMRAIDRLLHG